MDSNQLIKILDRQGFKVIRQKGSHVILINKQKTRIVIPVHPGKDLKPGFKNSSFTKERYRIRKLLCRHHSLQSGWRAPKPDRLFSLSGNYYFLVSGLWQTERDVCRRSQNALQSLFNKNKLTQTPLQSAKTPVLLLTDNALQKRNFNGKISCYANGFTTFMNL